MRQPRLTVAPFELDEWKLHAPPERPGIVARPAIVERLATCEQPVIAITAPAGYGKTTVLGQWAQRKGPRVAWLSLDDRDNDPAVLLTYLAVALDRVERIEPRVFRSLAAPGGGMSDVVRLVGSIAAMSGPVHLVLDHAEALTARECRDLVAELAVRLPAGSQLAIAARQQVLLPLPRLRAQGAVLELDAGDLALEPAEARSLLSGAGLRLDSEEADDLAARTEGWPAGLYLAALAINAGSSHTEVVRTFAGDDRFIGDYLRAEFLDRVSRADATFLTRTSILDSLTGGLCDATVGGSGSVRTLERLEHRNLLVVPLDRRGEWYRYHHLFRELLLAELDRREPEMVAELHVRAAAWYEENGQLEAAIRHAQRAVDADRVERLYLKVSNPVWASGRVDTVLRWTEWFSDHQLVDAHPAVGVHGCLIYALVGRAAEAEQWAAAAERAASDGASTDGNTMDGVFAYLRTLLCRQGVEAMRRDAHLALGGLSPTSPYRPAMLHADGVVHLLAGELDRADALFALAQDEASASGVTPLVAMLIAERGIVAIARDDWPEAEALAEQAWATIEGGEFDDYWTTALVVAWLARVEAHRGQVARARDLVVRAARLRPLLTYALPIVSVQALLELARAYLALADAGGALAVLRQIDDIHQHRRDLGTLTAQAAELRGRVELLRGEMLGTSSLTTAELRLLPLLATHLSLAEISARLVVSRNTVKTQAISIYRKLGVSTRSETITRMQQVGLVAHTG